jgi:hypothetical protein
MDRLMVQLVVIRASAARSRPPPRWPVLVAPHEAALRAGGLEVLHAVHGLDQHTVQVRLLLHVADMVRRSEPWISIATPRITGTAPPAPSPAGRRSGRSAMNSTMKGRSDSADSVAEAKKSRTISICASWCE